MTLCVFLTLYYSLSLYVDENNFSASTLGVILRLTYISFTMRLAMLKMSPLDKSQLFPESSLELNTAAL